MSPFPGIDELGGKGDGIATMRKGFGACINTLSMIRYTEKTSCIFVSLRLSLRV